MKDIAIVTIKTYIPQNLRIYRYFSFTFLLRGWLYNQSIDSRPFKLGRKLAYPTVWEFLDEEFDPSKLQQLISDQFEKYCLGIFFCALGYINLLVTFFWSLLSDALNIDYVNFCSGSYSIQFLQKLLLNRSMLVSDC